MESFSCHQNTHIADFKEGMEGCSWDAFMTTLLSEALNSKVDDWYEVDRIHQIHILGDLGVLG